MSNFIASNGVILDEHGDVYANRHCDGYQAAHEARKEFYQHLRDKELGRWRDPEDANMVAYRVPESDDKDGRAVRVIDELTGTYAPLWERDVKPPERRSMYATAARYFEAHPEPKPWHDAKPGEAWVLAAHDDADEYPYVTDSNGRFIDENFVTHKPEDFSSGRRIWPEDDSDG